jgi:nitroreductase
METFETIEKRRSMRSYLPEQIRAEELEKVLQAGLRAPHAGPFLISVVQKPELLKEIAAAALEGMKNAPIEFMRQQAAILGYNPLYGAPTLILFTSPADAMNGAANCALAAENVILAATDLGLSTCYMGSPSSALNGPRGKELAKVIGIPDGYVFRASVAIGYPGPEAAYRPPRREGGRIEYVR